MEELSQTEQCNNHRLAKSGRYYLGLKGQEEETVAFGSPGRIRNQDKLVCMIWTLREDVAASREATRGREIS